jgi:hypothetical protein
MNVPEAVRPGAVGGLAGPLVDRFWSVHAHPSAATTRVPLLVPALFAAVSVAFLAWSLLPLIPLAPTFNGYASRDVDLYLLAARRWLDGGAFYEPYQLQGAYGISYGDILYPPVVLWLLVPFLIVPTILWWAIPIALTGFGLARLRPSFVVWPLLALCVAWPPTAVRVATGNPVMWVVAAVMVGTVVAGPAALALVKPSLLPFAIWGIRRRAWWLWLIAFGVVCIPFGTMWVEWITVVMNSRGGGLLYSIQEVPMLLIPVIAWVGRTRLIATERT